MSHAIRIQTDQVTAPLRAMFDVHQPLALRCFAVLDGSILGQIWTDNLDQPTWGVVQESAFGTLFLGGQPDAHVVAHLVEELRQNDDVALALWHEHPYNQLVPPAPDFDGWELEFTERSPETDLTRYSSVPAGCELLPIDAFWFERCRYRDYYAAYFGSAEQTLKHGFGFCLVQGQELLSEAFAADAALGMIEVGTITSELYRRRGYAAVTCAPLILECETRGYATYWNCATDNLASAALARSMGYQSEKEFRYVVWYPPEQ